MRTVQCLVCVFALAGMAGCSLLDGRMPSMPRVHKITTQQGNVITQEMVDRLTPGMTKSQVHFVMGEPLLRSAFDDDRWVYIYTLQQPDRPRLTLHLTIHFENDVLATTTGDFAPQPAEAAGADNAKAASGTDSPATPASAQPPAGKDAATADAPAGS
jgi:outer membrane protein assembly factor BamE